eukprot:CAMPEP_0115122386 /NCGR_PEP_ID=MMETSP0227-20121206/46804_1 /TAXON_ID=89957 /ORGANISM="Polarella glacialis, Strain CCMP 1383" /LENGTH=100 /DNA_ID=CAMNT_0002524333 /DNA_START=47 /DNA_END=346 /DNA_ORIENTATION=-
MAAAQPQILKELQGGWLECMDEQGVYYFNQMTQQSSDQMPAEAEAMPAMAAPMQQQQQQQMQQQQQQQQAGALQQQQQQQQPQQQPASLKMSIGPWSVME